jgi:hypothetical protein
MKASPPILAALAALAATGVAAASGPAPTAQATAVQIHDIDADLLRGDRLRLEAETTGARRVTFTYAGRRYGARLVEIDHNERSREWARVVRARRADIAGRRRLTIPVRACSSGRCVARSSRELLEPPERRDD